VEDTWASRDLPVLDAAVRLLEDNVMVTVAGIAAATGIDPKDVARALDALQGRFVVEVRKGLGGDRSRWYIMKVTAEARQAVGQWPSAESVLTELVQGLSAAAEREADPERQRRLRQAASLLGGAVRDITIGVLERLVERSVGLG
jgi:DNA-binding MarR family transcriptional regulator